MEMLNLTRWKVQHLYDDKMLLYASNYKHESFSFQVNYSVILQENSDLDKLFVCFQIISKVEYCLSQTPVT